VSDADELLRNGDVAGARAALVDIVRSKPGDEQARMFLFQLLAVSGEWDKANTQLQSLAQLSAEAGMLAVTYPQAIEAEKLRAEVFAGKQAMPLLMGQETWAAGLAESISLMAKGDFAGAEAARDAAFEQAPDTPGTCDGIAFDWIADADGRFGPAFEAILGGKYGLVPFDQVTGITSEGPCDLRDIVWYPVQIAFRNGQSAAAFIPARYPGSEVDEDVAIRLARATGWADRDWGQQGSGQRLWSLSGGEDRGLLELRQIAFD
jgi:type VI secretion system protein ImpE